MSVISGKYNNTFKLPAISEWINGHCVGRHKSYHVWIDNTPKEIYSAIEDIRISHDLTDHIQKTFPQFDLENVREADEIYWAVSPKTAKGSDRSLVDCHYDGPYGIIPTDSIYYRVLLACNENNDVITVFPNDNVNVKMNTGDYHGLDYNKDYHCATGQIPEGKYRVIIKLHYILTPKNRPANMGKFIRFINVQWTIFSRWIMNMSADPTNIFQHAIGFMINMLTRMFANPSITVSILIGLGVMYYFLYRRGGSKRRR